MSNFSEVEQAIDILEFAAREKVLSEGQLSRVESLTELAKDTRPSIKKSLIAASENTIPKTYRQQYNRLPNNIKRRCNWKTISARLLANGSEKLKKAEAMRGGGELFGIDSEGRVLFKDKGVEPVMYGYDSKDKLFQLSDSDSPQRIWVRKWANYFEIREQVLKDGYELFSDDGKGNFSDEMKQVEAHTGEPFVASNSRKRFIASLLESGDKLDRARDALYDSDLREVFVKESNPYQGVLFRGVVRLLRV